VEVKPDVDNTDGVVSMVASKLRSGQDFKDPLPVEEEEEWYDKFLTQEDEKNVELGSKIVLLLEILADAAALEEKVLVFSHSLISLDVIEMALGGGEIGGNTEDWCRGCDYFRMDGSTSVQMRKRWSDIFNDEQNKA
jgi:SNF2 family DNA or RNA helicase